MAGRNSGRELSAADVGRCLLDTSTSMTESLEKLAPITVSVNVADPAGTLDGATDEMEGVAAEGKSVCGATLMKRCLHNP